MQLFHISFTNQATLDGQSHGHVISNSNTKTVLMSFLESLYFWSEIYKAFQFSQWVLLYKYKQKISMRSFVQSQSSRLEQGVSCDVIDARPDVVRGKPRPSLVPTRLHC